MVVSVRGGSGGATRRRRGVRRVGALALAGTLIGLLGAELTSARSCVSLTEDSLRPGDVVVVAKLTRLEVLSQEQHRLEPKTIAHIRVDEVIRGEKRIRKRHVTVHDACPSPDIACGLRGPIGRRYGLILDRRGGLWRGNSCSQVTPHEVRNLFGDDLQQ